LHVSRAVLTIPANATPKQAAQTILAGKLAGIKHIALLQEPIAAALACGQDWLNDEHHIVAVLDVGAGTTDVAFVESWSGCLEVISTAAATVGGRDLDNIMVELIQKKVQLPDDKKEVFFRQQSNGLLLCARIAKESLTEVDAWESDFEGHRFRVSRSEFEERLGSILDQIQDCIVEAANEAAVKLPNIGVNGAIPVTRIVLIGGSSQVPAIRRRAEKITSLEIDQSVDPIEAVALGACTYAGVLSGKIKSGMELNDAGFLQDLHGQTASQGFPF